MDVHAKLDEITALVETARAMPMSTSCLVNRAELLGELDELRRLLPGEVQEARTVLDDRAAILDEARQEAEELLADAEEERARRVADSEVVREATEQAERLVAVAEERAARTRAEIEDYVDRKLANFEVVLHKTLQAVARGRSKLSGRHELDELAPAEDSGGPPPG